MRLVVGLGNPGNEYRDTYHNVGFNAADMLATELGAPDFTLDKKSNALIADCMPFGERVLLCKPQTFMNLSGDAVQALSHYYKIPTEDILVVYDDIDIPKGTVRARLNGSAGTHNGMRDIVYKIGSTDFPRVRIGTGFKSAFMPLASYVLSHIPASERELMNKAFAAACEFVKDWLAGRPWTELTKNVNN